MKIAVKDANILIDLELMGLFDLWFQLPYETLTTSLVVQELRKGGHELALGYVGNNIESVAIDVFELAQELERYEDSGLSEPDVSVLYLAKLKRALLLSGDGKVRDTAAIEQVEIHGTIWILDQLIEHNILCPAVAASKLEYLLLLTREKKRFLPKVICEERITRWRTS